MRDWKISKVETSTRATFRAIGMNNCTKTPERFVWDIYAEYTVDEERYDFSDATFTPEAALIMVKLGLGIDDSGTMVRVTPYCSCHEHPAKPSYHHAGCERTKPPHNEPTYHEYYEKVSS